MNTPEGYTELAELALRTAAATGRTAVCSAYLAEAQVYATLAQAAATEALWRILNNAQVMA